MIHPINAELESKIRALVKRVDALEGKGFVPHTFKDVNVEKVAQFAIPLICSMFSVSLENLKSCRRPESIAWPRQVAIYVIHRTSKCTLQRVGDLFGKHHGTVMNAIARVTSRMDTEPHIKNQVETLLSSINIQFAPTDGHIDELMANELQ